MPYDPDRHHRRSIRLRGYDYTQAGAYFVTIVTQDRACLFGDIADGAMRLNDAGRMVQTIWDDIPMFYPGVDTGAFVVMPNHVHAVIVLVGAPRRGQPQGIAPTDNTNAGPVATARPVPADAGRGGVADGSGQPQGVAPTLSLADVVHRFKSLTTSRYADGVERSRWPPFRGRLWQRNYYEHVVRDEASLGRIRRYILDNPANWATDLENPSALQPGSEAAWAG